MNKKPLLLFCLLITCSACCDSKNIPTFLSELYSNNAKKRNEAALGLASCGDRAAEAVPRLSEMLYDPNVGVQSSAAYALRKIDTKEARESLESAIKARARKRQQN